MSVSPPRQRAIVAQARTAMDTLISQRVRFYDRERDLPSLLPDIFWGPRLAEPTTGAVRIALLLALARERRLGARRHRGYSLSRHIALAVAYRAETDATPVTTNEKPACP